MKQAPQHEPGGILSFRSHTGGRKRADEPNVPFAKRKGT